jgi:hypothetical protein
MTRRSLLASAGVLIAGRNLHALPNRIRLGGPVFLKSDDPDELAAEHRRLGYSAAYCPKLDVNNTERIRAAERAFAKAQVVIAEVGAWKNLLIPTRVNEAPILAT